MFLYYTDKNHKKTIVEKIMKIGDERVQRNLGTEEIMENFEKRDN